jgi:Peptidase family M1 domain
MPKYPGLRWLPALCVTSVSALLLTVPPAASPVLAGVRPGLARCGPGAHTLAPAGSHLYPETGNGGYTSVHTDVDLVYDAAADLFMPGNHVVLTDRATQCLTSFSLDFERKSANTKAGPDLTVRAVTVNGKPARFAFVQPTYPGDRHGMSDPNPLAHEASEDNPVGGPHHNPLPPACTPELATTNPAEQNSLNGTQCPANKLVITPAAPVKSGAVFTVSVSYTGRPGVHNDGDGTTEGWFRAPDGGFVTTEPVGTEDWMPLNDYPAAKPTYDFYDTVNAGKTVIGNGVLAWVRPNKPDTEFPHGSVTYHWHMRSPVASYLVEDSVGDYDLTERTADNGIRYYEAQDASIPAAQQKKNLAIMNQQENITQYESEFSGTFPFTSDGVVIGTPQASFEEEMETMITMAGGTIGLSVFYHENMHQWWGDNVTEGGYDMTFYKEGMAVLAQYLLTAREAEMRAGGPTSRRGQAAFQASLVKQFNTTYNSKGYFWTVPPSNPTPYELFGNANTYERPPAAYIALRQILGSTNFAQALLQIQRDYGGGHITEPELEAAFHHWMPNQSAACQARLGAFFTEWFDTAYPRGGGADSPQITGPGLDGPGFYNATGGCTTS